MYFYLFFYFFYFLLPVQYLNALNHHLFCLVSQAFLILIDFKVSITSKILRIVLLYFDYMQLVTYFTASYKVRHCDSHFVKGCIEDVTKGQ